MRTGLTALTVLLLLGVAGCQKVNYSKEVDLGLAEVWWADFDPPSYGQTVHVAVDPEACSVSAYLVKKSDADEVRAALDRNKVPAPNLVLAGKTFKLTDEREAFSFDAKVPAKTGYVLYVVGGAKKTKVNVKVVGK